MRAATVVQVLQDFEAPPTIAPRPSTTAANPHIDRSLGSKETHIQSHNLFVGRSAFKRSRRRITAPPRPLACPLGHAPFYPRVCHLIRRQRHETLLKVRTKAARADGLKSAHSLIEK